MNRWLKFTNGSKLTYVSLLAFASVVYATLACISGPVYVPHSRPPVVAATHMPLVFPMYLLGLLLAILAICRVRSSNGKLHGELFALLTALLSLGGMLMMVLEFYGIIGK